MILLEEILADGMWLDPQIEGMYTTLISYNSYHFPDESINFKMQIKLGDGWTIIWEDWVIVFNGYIESVADLKVIEKCLKII